MFRTMKHEPIKLSPERLAYAEEAASAGGYASIADYLTALIDAERRAQERLEELLLEGLNSEELDWTPELFEQIRRDARLAS